MLYPNRLPVMKGLRNFFPEVSTERQTVVFIGVVKFKAFVCREASRQLTVIIIVSKQVCNKS